jgi:hypothetical protein
MPLEMHLRLYLSETIKFILLIFSIVTVAHADEIALTSNGAKCNAYNKLAPFDFAWKQVWFSQIGSDKETIPQTVEFSTDKDVRVSVNRLSHAYSAPVRIRLESRGSNDENYALLCEWSGDVGPSNYRPSLEVLFLNKSLRHLRLIVQDVGGGGPTGESPYSINAQIEFNFQGAISSTDAQAMQFNPSSRGWDFHADPVTQDRKCTLVENPKPSQAKIEKIEDIEVPISKAVNQRVVYEEAGRYLYLQPSRLGGNSTSIAGSVFVKNSGEGVFEKVCEFALQHDISDSSWLMASANQPYLFYPIWRVELRALSENDKTRDEKANISVARDLDSERVYTFGNDLTNATRAAYVCQPPSRTREGIPTTSGTEFSQAPIFSARILDPDNLLTPKIEDDIVALLLESVSLWRRSCHGCSPENLVFAEIDNRFFALWDGIGFQAEDLSRTPFVGRPPTVLDSRSGSRTPVQIYKEIPRNGPLVKNLCAIHDQLTAPLQRVQMALGCPDQAADASAKRAPMRLLLENGPTSCGDDTEIVACEPDGILVELNARDYMFVAPFTGKKLFGNGQTQVDLLHVLLHEAGHWIGLGHIDQGESIMASSVEQGRCIDENAVAAVRTIVLGKERRIYERSALRYSLPSRP